jgi:signal transduction histidine kinase
MLLEIISVHEHNPTATFFGLLVFATCSFISIKMKQFIQKPEIQKGWNAFILLTIATTFIHFITILFWLIDDEPGFDLMEEVVHYIGSAVVLLLFTGFFFVQRGFWRSFDKIDEAFKVKSAFMHSVSHEMRTPLNAIIGYADMHLLLKGTIPTSFRSPRFFIGT